MEDKKSKKKRFFKNVKKEEEGRIVLIIKKAIFLEDKNQKIQNVSINRAQTTKICELCHLDIYWKIVAEIWEKRQFVMLSLYSQLLNSWN